MWEGVGDRTELQYIDPHFYGHQRCVFLVLLMLNQRPGGSAFCWVLTFSTTSSLQFLWSPTQSRVPKAPSTGWWLSLPHLVSNFLASKCWLPIFTELYNSSIAHSISLEWHVCSSSSGNNCHAVHFLPVHQSMTIPWDIYLVPYFSQPAYAISSHNCHRNVHHFGMACLAGSKVNIQHHHWIELVSYLGHSFFG